jgi:tripartite-type tricarboxylate transporter receptor subunit TctC
VIFTAATQTLPHVKAGRLRVLGVTRAQRVPLFPDVPAIAEAGYPQYEVTGWYGIFTRAGTPRDVVARLNAEAVKAVNDPATRERLRESALDPIGSSAEDLGRIVRESHERMGALIRKIGLQPQ